MQVTGYIVPCGQYQTVDINKNLNSTNMCAKLNNNLKESSDESDDKTPTNNVVPAVKNKRVSIINTCTVMEI